MVAQLVWDQWVAGSNPATPTIVIGAISSVGQSVRLITGRSGVQVPDGPPISKCYKFAQIAQLVEQRTENPRVLGSIPSLGTMNFSKKEEFFSLWCKCCYITTYDMQKDR